MHIIDRRLNPGGKSLPNRQRFLRRAKEVVERAVRDATRDRSIGDLESAGEVSIPTDGIREPTFRQTGGNRRDIILPGNKTYVEGDTIERPRGGQGQGGGNGAGNGEASEDEFRFMLSREEFLSIFLDDLELPDLAKQRVAVTETEGLRRAGYTTSGSPANLSVARTMRSSLSRRLALSRPKLADLEALETALAEALDRDDEAKAEALRAAIVAMEARRARIPYLDPLDLRYRRFEPFPKPVTQAVMFCLMDVSGSMTEHMKDLAKRFYMLLHVFLARRYKHVEVVFIRHTDEAREVDEETFFRSAETGGTMVSSAFVEMARIVRERYDPAAWNIYAAEASDGDNHPADNERTKALLTEEILPICQYFAYVEVSEPGGGPSAFIHPYGNTALWRTYQSLQTEGGKFQMRRVARREEIYPVFRQLFQQRAAGTPAEASS